MNNRRFPLLLLVLLLLIAVNVLVLYIPGVTDLRVVRQTRELESGIGRFKDLASGKGLPLTGSGANAPESLPGETRQAEPSPAAEPARPPLPDPGRYSLPDAWALPDASRRRIEEEYASQGLLTPEQVKTHLPASGLLESELVDLDYVRAARSRYEGRIVRYATHFRGFTNEVLSYRPMAEPETARAEFVVFLSAFDDSAGNFVSRTDYRLLYKCSLMEPGERMHVLGQVRCTQTGIVVLVRDVAAFR